MYQCQFPFGPLQLAVSVARSGCRSTGAGKTTGLQPLVDGPAPASGIARLRVYAREMELNATSLDSRIHRASSESPLPRSDGVQVVPSKWTIVPRAPAAQTSSTDLPRMTLIWRRRSRAPGRLESKSPLGQRLPAEQFSGKNSQSGH